MESRWFLLPTDRNARGVRFPKHIRVKEEYTRDGETTTHYESRVGVDGFAGKVVDISGARWDDSPIELPLSGEVYIAHINGDEQTLDAIAGESDAYTIEQLGLSKERITELLNTRFEQSRSFNEWEASIGVK